ncbi:hypothetical protein J2Z49_001519 [Desulfofundulus luciae]|uniref:Uncharacterized protein n=1 Tax=Desulfofundulus luciae TaxID=74702 RepID=A0ABU0B2D0_9FIRM|nr:hypothetical protein [Desulfofundulus luciae]
MWPIPTDIPCYPVVGNRGVYYFDLDLSRVNKVHQR